MGTSLLTQTPTALSWPGPTPLCSPTPKCPLHTGPRPTLTHLPPSLHSPASSPSPLRANCGIAQLCGSAHQGGVPWPSSSHPTHYRTDSSWSPSPVQSVRRVWWWTQHVYVCVCVCEYTYMHTCSCSLCLHCLCVATIPPAYHHSIPSIKYVCTKYQVTSIHYSYIHYSS